METPDWLRLEADESLVWTGSPSRRRTASTTAAALVWSAGILGFAYAFVHLIPPVLNRAAIAPARYVWVVAWALVALWVAFVPVKFLGLYTTEYALTDRNVYARSGGFSETVSRVPIDEVKNTTVRRGLFGGFLEYGTVEVDAGGSGSDVTLVGLDSPERFQDELRSLENAGVSAGSDDGVDVAAGGQSAENGPRSTGADPQ